MQHWGAKWADEPPLSIAFDSKAQHLSPVLDVIDYHGL